MNAGGVFFAGWLAFMGVVLVLGVGSLAVSIWTIVDAARRPDYQFQLSGQNKVLWIVLGALGVATCQLVGLVAGIIYLTTVRKKLDAVVAPPGWGGYPPGYGSAPPGGGFAPWYGPPLPSPSSSPLPSSSPPPASTPPTGAWSASGDRPVVEDGPEPVSEPASARPDPTTDEP